MLRKLRLRQKNGFLIYLFFQQVKFRYKSRKLICLFHCLFDNYNWRIQFIRYLINERILHRPRMIWVVTSSFG